MDCVHQPTALDGKSVAVALWCLSGNVFENGAPIGWQAKKPDDYGPLPYVSRAIDAFDRELSADEILWPEGEKDVDNLNGVNLPAFTFGGVGQPLSHDRGPLLRPR